MSKSLCFLCFLLFNLCLLLPNRAVLAQATSGAAIAPFLDEQTLVVGRIDLGKVDAKAAAQLLLEIVPDKDPQVTRQLAAAEQKATEMLHVLTQGGMSELYLVFSLADMPKEPLFVVAPVKAGHDSQKGADLLRGVARMEAADVKSGAAVAGSAATIERLKKLEPTPRPEFAKGFEKAGNSAAQFVFAPSADTRRVLREMLPRLPDEIGGGSGKMLADGVQWAVLGVEAPPRLAFSLTIQSKDADAAAALRGTIISGLALMRAANEKEPRVPRLDDVIRVLTPQVKGDQLVMTAGEQGGGARTLLNLLLPAVQASRTSAGRAQSMNNLKHIALAIHNYHDQHKRLPPRAIRGKDGKALLSWRVAILPYLDAEALYKEFHLDEPWDSEHNKRLIDKLPAVLASPNLGAERRANGMTSYLAPLTRQPPAVAVPQAADGTLPMKQGKVETVFDPIQGTKFQQITDGTSNTILVLEANQASAVIWTKPDDLVVDLDDLLKGLRGQPDDGFCTAFCDGSAHFLKNTLDPQTLRRLLQMNDGQPVGQYH